MSGKIQKPILRALVALLGVSLSVPSFALFRNDDGDQPPGCNNPGERRTLGSWRHRPFSRGHVVCGLYGQSDLAVPGTYNVRGRRNRHIKGHPGFSVGRPFGFERRPLVFLRSRRPRNGMHFHHGQHVVGYNGGYAALIRLHRRRSPMQCNRSQFGSGEFYAWWTGPPSRPEPIRLTCSSPLAQLDANLIFNKLHRRNNQ